MSISNTDVTWHNNKWYRYQYRRRFKSIIYGTLFHKCAFRLGHVQRLWHLGGLPSQQMQSLPTTKKRSFGRQFGLIKVVSGAVPLLSELLGYRHTIAIILAIYQLNLVINKSFTVHYVKWRTVFYYSLPSNSGNIKSELRRKSRTKRRQIVVFSLF
jgi:hypothetical protein